MFHTLNRSHPDVSPRARRIVGMVLAGAASMSLASCASSTSDGQSMELSLVRGTSSVELFSYVADKRGYFDQEGVTVDLVPPAGANVPTLIASGQADLASYSPPGALLTSQGGKRAVSIYGLAGAGFGGAMVGSTDIPDVAALQAKSTCTIASLPQGTVGYAAVDELMAQLDIECEHVAFPDAAGITGALVSGRADAMVGAIGPFASSIRENNLPIILDTTNAEIREQYFPQGGYETMIYGLADNLEDKREATEAFLRAMNTAREWSMNEANYQELAGIVAEYPGFEGLSADEIISDVVETTLPYLGPVTGAEGGGTISDDGWQATIDRVATFNLPDYRAEDPANELDQAVDMTFLENALTS